MDKIAGVICFRAETTLEEGLKKTIAWYVENRHIWQRQLWLRNIEIEVAGGKILH